MNLIDYKIRDRVGFITLNRPEKRNALNHEIISQLKEAFSKAEDNEDVKIVVLKGNGEAFCAGADLEYLQQLQDFSYEQNFADSNHLKELFHQIYTLKKVVIAQVQGHALAGGCGLVTVCDFAFSVSDAKFGYTEVKIGFIPAIVMIFLIRKIGEARAKSLLLSGSLINAEKAKQMALINEVVSKENLENEVLYFAEQLIVSNSAHAMSLTKQMIAKVQTLSLEEALSFASEMNAKARGSEDCKRGIAAFLNKDKIAW